MRKNCQKLRSSTETRCALPRKTRGKPVYKRLHDTSQFTCVDTPEQPKTCSAMVPVDDHVWPWGLVPWLFLVHLSDQGQYTLRPKQRAKSFPNCWNFEDASLEDATVDVSEILPHLTCECFTISTGAAFLGPSTVWRKISQARRVHSEP